MRIDKDKPTISELCSVDSHTNEIVPNSHLRLYTKYDLQV